MHAYRTHNCSALRRADVGAKVRLSGWVHRKRDHGGLLFVDLRDHYGLTQIVADSDSAVFEKLDQLRLESVITITGEVVERAPEVVNPNLATGEIEIRASDVDVQSFAQELPLPVAGEADYPEDIRLRYRYLDLRRDRLHRNIVLRSNVIASLRRRMIEQGFNEYQTPILTASSPEGARDYLVPSRVHPGKFYALPQAPQMFKQLMMVAGFDRYFQIAPCFRDEDARADRSPGEFYQLDFEMSFVTQEDVFATIEPVLAGVFEEFGEGKKVTPAPFPRIAYRDAMLYYGSDKPDLRNPLKISDVSEHFRDSGFGLFAGMVAKGAVVRAIPAPEAGKNSRKFFDDMNNWAREEGFAGLGYINIKNGEAGGPIARNLGEEATKKLLADLGLGDNDGVFFAAGKESEAARLAGLARNRVGELLDLVEKDSFRFCWVVDFPMFEYDEDAKQVIFSHNPFSMPQGGMEALENKDPLDILAYQYDIVCNGIELSSGAIRNHRPDIMYKAFETAGYDQAMVDENFAGMINAFKYGAPPHGGAAPGVDRMVMLLAGEPNIREVVVFPMNQKAEDLMMGAPAVVSERQLKELSLRIATKPTQKSGS
ncbi:aspartyl-tRNA synthetase [Zymomonas mobilis]|uniref:Aspartate--tRNA(Asp/Asn) ligase n=1 Tax=Zymomonas mobilis TaxID=542 RepID=A0A542W0Q1_ZYMMB|nr:aspartate--tRNA ligase [Zymomonas mobilis]TQL17161.1 aspartyl-tRNA synthetase [Zymomonas mobilis]